MKVVTKKVVGAFNQGIPACLNNTSTDGNNLFLFGNRIAKREHGKVFITTAGWDTITTRDRLNGIEGVRVHHEKGELYFNGEPWDGSWVEVVLD